MEPLHIDETLSSPAVQAVAEESVGRINLSGKSYPENAAAFYSPLFEWTEQFLLENADAPLAVEIEMLYLNSSSSKIFMNLFEMLDEAAASGAAVSVRWLYDPENETAQEIGAEFQEDVDRLHIELVEKR